MGEATRISQEIDAGRERNRQGAGRDRIDKMVPEKTPSLVQDTADLVKTPPGDGLKTPETPDPKGREGV